MNASVILEYLESIAPLSLQEDYDNAGLLVGNANTEINGALICLDVTEAVLDEAIQLNCNLVICHHPILFKPIKKLNGIHYVEKVLLKAIKNNILIYAIHTNLDNTLRNGVNEELAIRLGLENLEILLPKSMNQDTGAGILGKLKVPIEPDQFLLDVKQKVGCSVIKYTPFGPKKIQNVALCGGSGAFLIPVALASKADVFITSDLKYHEFFESTQEMSLLDIGHYESEKFTIDLLYRLVTQKFSNFAAHYTKINTNPIKYY